MSRAPQGKPARAVPATRDPEVKVVQLQNLLKGHSLKAVMAQTTQGPVEQSQYTHKQLQARIQDSLDDVEKETAKGPTGIIAVGS